jgi:hypothetical protein
MVRSDVLLRQGKARAASPFYRRGEIRVFNVRATASDSASAVCKGVSCASIC